MPQTIGQRSAQRVAIFGGSFDPIHFGHLWTAQYAAERLLLDEILFLPAATSPLKPQGAQASNQQRLEMLQQAIEGTPTLPLPAPGPRTCRLTIDDRELRRGGISYTFDTVQQIQHQRAGDTKWFLMIGSDAFAAIQKWHRAAELLQRILPLVYRRGGDPAVDWQILDTLVSADRAAEIQAASLTLPLIELSSSQIRSRVAEGMNVRFELPAAVADYIAKQRLYQVAVSPS